MQKKWKHITSFLIAGLAALLLISQLPGGAFAAELSQAKPAEEHYYAEVELWDASGDTRSVYDFLLQNNRKVLLTVKDGAITEIAVALNPIRIAQKQLEPANDTAADRASEEPLFEEGPDPEAAEEAAAEEETREIPAEPFWERAVSALQLEGKPAAEETTSFFLAVPEQTMEPCLSKAVFKLDEARLFQPGEDLWIPVTFRLTTEETGRQDAWLRICADSAAVTAAKALVSDSHIADATEEPFLSTAVTGIRLAPGETLSLRAYVAGTTDPKAYQLHYQSEDPSVVTVTKDGTLKAVGSGTAFVAVSAHAEGQADLERYVLTEVETAEEAPVTEPALPQTPSLQEKTPGQIFLMEEFDDEEEDADSDDDEDFDDEDPEDEDFDDEDFDDEDDDSDDEDLNEDEDFDDENPEDYESELLDIGDELVEYEDEATGILIQYVEGTIDPEPDDMDIEVKAVASGALYDFAAEDPHVKGKPFSVYSIRLTDGTQDVTPNGTALIYIPIPDGWDGAKMMAYQIGDDGALTALQGDLDDEYFAFLTTGWGTFAIVEDTVVHNGYLAHAGAAADAVASMRSEEEPHPATTAAPTTTEASTTRTTPNAKTGDEATASWWILLAVLSGVAIAGSAFGLRRKQKS